MFLLAITILAGLTLVNFLTGKKAIFYPPVVFCLLWTVNLLVIAAAGDFFFPLSPETLLLFCGGCVFFSLGSALAGLWPVAPREDVLPMPSSRLLTFFVFLIVLAIPLGYRWMTELSSGYGSTWLMAARIATLDPENEGLGLGVFNSVVGLSTAVAMIAFCEREQSGKRSFIAIVAALILNLLTGGRAGVTSLIFALICLDWLKTRRVRWKPLMLMFSLLVITFSAIAIYVQKGDVRADASLSQNLGPIVDDFVLYSAGASVAFDRVIRDPYIVPHNWHVNRFFLQLANKLGARVEVPPLHAEFVHLGPNSLFTNVYTFYFAYMDWGYIGICGMLAALGFVITLCYRRAVSGGKIAMLMYGMLFAGLMLSIFNEFILMNLNFLIRLFVLSWLLYAFPAAWAKFRKLTKTLVTSEIASHTGPPGFRQIQP